MIMDNDLLLSQDRLSPHCVRAVIAHLLASRFPQPKAFGAKVQVFFSHFEFGLEGLSY